MCHLKHLVYGQSSVLLGPKIGKYLYKDVITATEKMHGYNLRIIPKVFKQHIGTARLQIPDVFSVS